MTVSKTEKREGIAKGYIAGAMARYGYTDEDMQKLLGISGKTWLKCTRNPSLFSVGEMWILIETLHFTPPQAASLALGRDLTAADFKNYLCV